MPAEPIFKPMQISDWNQLVKFHEECEKEDGQWIFRGQHNSCWALTTKLERAIKRYELDLSEARELERGLIRRFKRHCHHYLQSLPENTLEWLALMQHFGAPTRLLDWTYSFWVAVFFAVESASSECAVWALNSSKMIKPFESIVSEHQSALRF